MTLEDVADRAGVSFQLIGFAATDKRWARESLSWRSAQLIEEALGVARGELFEYREVLNARERKEMG
jgi:transcriptional regulator with XRE-family HTH domain